MSQNQNVGPEFTGQTPTREGHKKARTSRVATSALASTLAASLATKAHAQDGGPSVVSAVQLENGDVQIVLSDGRSVIVNAADYQIVDGQIVLSQAVASDLNLADTAVLSTAGEEAAASGGVGTLPAILGGVVALGAAAGGGGGGGGGSNGTRPAFSSDTTANVAENQTAAYTAVATDADGDTITYSLSGTDAALFEIDSTTGAVTFISAPDFETPGDADGDNVYDVVVTATAGRQTVDQNVAITVTNVNDNAPAFSSDPTANAAENQTAAYTAVATDADGDAVTYSLSGTDAALFEIDSTTGAVTFISAPDFETPGDADGDNVYDVVVTATAGGQTVDQNVAITVTNVDDNAPTFSSGSTASLAENQTAAYSAIADDVDGDTITYSLSGTDAALFEIDSTTGAVTFISAPDFETPGDADGDNIYDVVVTATAGSQTVDQNVAITVTNTDDNAPVFTSGTAANAAENQTAAYDANANDVDRDTVTYSLSGTDAALFEIDSTTGAVTFISAPDFETPGDADGDNVYDVVVTATAGGQTVDQNVAITVTNVDDNAPTFSSGSTASLTENQTAAYSAIADDVDGDTITYSLSGTDAALFEIDSTTGAVTFISAPDFETPGDADGDNIYDVVVTATAGSQTVDQNVAITVTNSDDNAPVFTSGTAANAAENQTAAYDANANDVDRDTVTYSLSGTDAALFEIDSTTGAVTFISAPDFETPGDADGDNVYDVVVTATAGDRTTNQNVAITVTNENDNRPVFTSDTTAIVAENQTLAYTAVVTDADGDAITYSLASSRDVALFDIDSATGVVTFRAAPDFEAPSDTNGNNVYELVIVAEAGGVSISQFVMITVANVNDNAPAFSSDTTANAAENQTAAYTAVATDADGDAVTYSLSGTDAALFEIDSTTGAVTFISAPDFETPRDADGDNIYDVVVTATAGGQAVDQNVAITLTNIISETVDLSTLTPSQGFIIQGDSADDRAGSSVSSAGDVNGDGFEDFIVGAPLGDDGGNLAGEAYVVYGSASGANIDLSTLTPSQGFIIQGDLGGDFAGVSVSSAGDVNGDGFDDVIVGASSGDDGGFRAGEAYVIYGGASGANIDLSTLTPSQGFIIIGDMAEDGAGTSVSSAGDVNGDGFDDVIIGAPAGDDGGTNAGEAYVVYGSASGTNIDLSTLTPTQGFIIQGDLAGDSAGGSVSSAGDVNGDGFDDIFIGAPGADDGGTNAGEAYVVYGSASGANIDLSTLTPTQGFIIQGNIAGDNAGSTVSSAGDVNGDGFDDLIIGALGGDTGGLNFGEAYVVYGSASGANIDLSTLTPSQGFIIIGDGSGIRVSSAGDVNGDGFDDVIIGSNFDDTGGVRAGAAYVVYGGTAGTNVDLGALSETQGFFIQGDEAFDQAGDFVSSAGDVNGDGFDDLIVGAGRGDDGGTDAGEAYVIYGGATETESTEAVSRTGTAAADNFTGNAGADSFGNIGTDDVVRGGAGDDVITITSLDFADVDGGHGTDSLVLDGSGLNLDLTGARTDVENFELIDLTGTGNNILTLDRLSLLDLSEDTSGGITTFTVLGDAGDAIILNDLADWTNSGQRDVDGNTFDVFTNGAAELLVDDAVSVINIAFQV